MSLILALSLLISDKQAAILGPVIAEESARYKIDPLLVSAVIHRESRFGRGRCFKGAYGLMQIQIKNKSCDRHGELRARFLNLYSDRGNIARGVRLMAFWKNWCQSSGHTGHHWLLHYNQGFGRCPKGRSCNRRSRIPITSGKIGGYAQRVLKTYTLLKEAYEGTPTS